MARCVDPCGWAESPGYSSNGCVISPPSSTPSKGSFFLPCPSGAVPPYAACGPSPGSFSAEAKAAAASRIHSLAEKRRRERINAHLSTLRSMIPNSNKMDKATLLSEVINQVKNLRRKAMHVSSQGFPVPKEVDEVTVESEEKNDIQKCCADEDLLLIRASICCDDRPDLLHELVEAFQGLRLKLLRADMATLGGRATNMFVLSKEHQSGGDASMSSLVEAVRESLGRVASTDSVSNEMSSKRRRLLQLHCSNMYPE